MAPVEDDYNVPMSEAEGENKRLTVLSRKKAMRLPGCNLRKL
jgi:hypothetical protein